MTGSRGGMLGDESARVSDPAYYLHLYRRTSVFLREPDRRRRSVHVLLGDVQYVSNAGVHHDGVHSEERKGTRGVCKMKTVYMCRVDEFCPDCTETGGEYGTTAQYHCMAVDGCRMKDVNCMFVQSGGKRV